MSLYPIMNLSIEIQRQSTVSDAYGDDRLGPWATISTVNGWLDLNNKKVIEVISNRDEANSDGLCYLPAGTDVLQTDRIVVNSTTYQVFGIPSLIIDPRDGSVHHIEMRVREYRG